MDGIRILMTHEPRAYRETMAAALRHLRPGAEVVASEANALAAGVDRWRPHLVITSDPNLAELVPRSSSVLLYPRGSGEVVVSVAGRCQAPADFTIDALLEVIDQTERLARTTAP